MPNFVVTSNKFNLCTVRTSAVRSSQNKTSWEIFTGRDNFGAQALLSSLHVFSLCYQNNYSRSYSSVIECYASTVNWFFCLSLYLTENTQLLF